jgi:3-oxoadipate enol-lactonase
MTSRTIRTTGAELVVDDAGCQDPALVFLHYWGGSARTWAPVLRLLPATVRRLAINQRGWGGSRVTDGRYDLAALADDVTAVVGALGIGRYVLVGHSMGGKVAQLVAGRQPPGLAGLVLVAPAPPVPMSVPEEIRDGMLASYQSREGILEALRGLAGPALDGAQRERVIEDTLSGEPGAKRYWPEHGMTADISLMGQGLKLPVEIVLGEHDLVERPSVLRPLLSRLIPHATFTTVPGAGHLLPLEAPQAVAARCEHILGVAH